MVSQGHGRRRRMVPVRFQLTPTECGAACLAMVASYHGRHTLVLESRELLGVGRDGVSARQLAAAAATYGLVGRAERCDDPFAQPLDGPAIAFVNDGHFVVLERVGRRFVRIVDPATGRNLMTRTEFRDRYRGVLVRLTPGPDFSTRRASWRDALLSRYLREFVATAGSRRLLAGIVLAATLLLLLGLALPLSTQFVVDRVIPDARDDLLPTLAVGVLGTAVLYGALTLLRVRLLLALRVRADRLLTQRFVSHLLRLPLPYFMQRARGDLLMRLSSVSSTREQLTHQVLTLMLDAALLSGYVIGLGFWVPQYLPLVLALGAAQVLVLVFAYRRLRTLARRETQAKAEEQSFLVELLEAVAPVKANGIEPAANARWSRLFETYQTAMFRRGRVSAWVDSAQGALTTLAPLALLWFGLTLVLQGNLTLGTMLAANSIAMAALAPLANLVGVLQLFTVLRAQVERIYDVLDAQQEKSGVALLPPGEPAAVEVSDVSFRYQASGPAVLSGVSFQLPPGGKLGVVGRTGSGKSTLALLVLGLLRGQGTIRHNSIPLERLDVAQLRRSSGVVLQELTLFNGTIYENLTLGRSDLPDSDVEQAACLAGLHDDVQALPMRYHTSVGEGGAALSAGQRQRVALARALLHRPRLLVLDEATSHLDPKTEREVDESLAQLDVTRIVISHRLSAIRNADLILVMDRGRIAASGTHDQLIGEEGGLYRELFGPSLDGPASHAVGQTPTRHGAPNGGSRAPSKSGPAPVHAEIVARVATLRQSTREEP